MPEDEERIEEEAAGPRAIWSGTISFGLLSLPVDLFPAHRTQVVSLRMVDEEGRPLQRRYYCPEHERQLRNEEIVRGYPVDEDRFVVVTDEELERLAPDKSREIDLRKFAKVEDIDPVYFNRSYFLTPGGDEAVKAYNLLAETMQRSGRVGIATFVMRGKQYLVALLAERGILRAVTLRYHDDLRAAEVLELEPLPRSKLPHISKYQRAIKGLAQDELEPRELADRYAARLRERVAAKLEDGTDVVALPEDEAEPESEAEIIDLMEVLKQRLNPEQRERRAEPARAPRGKGGRAREDALEKLSREELYERAKARNVPGRSKMDKTELIKALRA